MERSAILAPHEAGRTPRPRSAGLDRRARPHRVARGAAGQTAKDVKRAQKLRYRVFYEEMAAVPDLSLAA